MSSSWPAAISPVSCSRIATPPPAALNAVGLAGPTQAAGLERCGVGSLRVQLVIKVRVAALRLSRVLKGVEVHFMIEMREMISDGCLPEPTDVRKRCEECEYANYCGDVW